MPIFMDRHDVPGATAANVAVAHQKDLGVQGKYQCRTMTYWFDEARAVAFCLVEAPDADAVALMHKEAHGLVPSTIIQVHHDLVETFLGRIGDPVTTETTGALGMPVFVDTAFRTVLAVELKDVAVLTARRRRRPGASSRVRRDDQPHHAETRMRPPRKVGRPLSHHLRVGFERG